jgi:hypothetical protein
MDQPKSWYKKKRLIIPVAILGLFALSKLDNTNSNQVINNVQNNNKLIEQTAPISDDLQTPVENTITIITSQDEVGESSNEPTKTPTPSPKITIIPVVATPKAETSKKVNPPEKQCDPNYSGCVPIASDVDCAGGKGNGPAYTGRTTVIGSDIYDLDRDGDGVACE